MEVKGIKSVTYDFAVGRNLLVILTNEGKEYVVEIKSK